MIFSFVLIIASTNNSPYYYQIQRTKSFEILNYANIKYRRPITEIPYKFFGPLQLEINKAKRFEEIYIIPGLNNDKQRIFLALNCKFKILNVTGSQLKWKEWSKPKHSFEYNILKTFCI